MINIDNYIHLHNLNFYHSRQFLLCSYLINSYHPRTTAVLTSITINKSGLFYNFTMKSYSFIFVSVSFTKNNASELQPDCCIYKWVVPFYCWMICFLPTLLFHTAFPQLQPPTLVIRSKRILFKDSPSGRRKTC